MSNEISQSPWWTLSSPNYPSQFRSDQRLMEAARLKALLVSDSDGHKQDELWIRIRRAATLLETAALERKIEGEDIWSIVALIHEASGVYDREGQDYLWLLSALCWQLADAPSIAEHIANILIANERVSGEKRNLIEQIAIAFSRRDFIRLRGLAEMADEDAQKLRSRANQEQSWEVATNAGILLSLSEVIRYISKYVTYVDDQLPDLTKLQDFLAFANLSTDARLFRVGRLLTECLYKFISSSSRLLIDEYSYATTEARENLFKYTRQYAELWPSQQQALSDGLLSNTKNHFVVAVPTSSGKTLCGELAMIKKLSEDPETVCFYVVPSRALVEEKSQELRKKFSHFGFKVTAATGALQSDELEGAMLLDAQVIVCTPEKLDLLIRHDDVSQIKASLFIIDEIQMINDGDRGLGLEFVVIKLLILKPEARIILLSAMLPNSEDFGRWLLRSTVSASSWRPTRQRFGEVSFAKRKPSGVIMHVNLYDLSGNFDGIEIPIQEYKRQPQSDWEKVIMSVEAFRRKGPVLVFCMTKNRCEFLVDKIVNYLNKEKANYPIRADYSPSREVEELRQRIKREISEDFLLRESLLHGVAYHHADLPPRIRIALEHLIANNLVEVVFSTTTLAEGVNLPISTVIFEDWMTHVDPRSGRTPEPLDLSKFRNIAGRAGRARKEAEGLILFLDPKRKPVKRADGKEVSPKDYFVRDDYPSISSRFLEIVTKYRVPKDEDLDSAWLNSDLSANPQVRQALRQFGLAVLHAMEVFHLGSDEELVDFIVDSSLLATQAPEEKVTAKQWFSTWVNFYRRVKLDNEELRPIAMQIGLPLRAVQRLYAHLISDNELISCFMGGHGNDLHLSEQQIAVATRAVASIDELDWEPKEAPHDLFMTLWLNGVTVNQLTGRFRPFLKEKTRHLERTCNYAMQKLSNSGAWGMYALSRVLELIVGKENLSPIVKRLPLLMYFGVNNVPSTIFSLIGIERLDSLALGKAYIAEGHEDVGVGLLKSWARSLEFESLLSILRGNNDREIDYETLQILKAE